MKYFTKFLVLIQLILITVAVNLCSAQGSVSGYVMYSDNLQPVTSGYVQAYNLNGTMVASGNIQSNGSYNIVISPNQEIDIIGVPNLEPEMDSFVPTIHPNKTDWQSAVMVDPSTSPANVNIYVTRIPPGGNSVLSYVSGNVTLDKKPIKDAIIYAKLGNTIMNFGITNSEGNFVINSLPIGNYTLSIHRVGSGAVEAPVPVTIGGTQGLSYNLAPVQIKKENAVVKTYKMSQNYPNPFNPITTIKYDLPKSGNVKISIYNSNGQLVTVLVNEAQTSGSYNVEFDASGLASGVYFYRIDANGFADTKKMILVK